MRKTTALFFVLAAGLVSCSDSTSPTIGESGSLSFTYTGAGATGATSYSATGALPANVATGFGSSAWAAGAIGSGETQVMAVLPNASKWDVVNIVIDRTSVGASTIDITCSANNCTEIGVTFGSNQFQSNYTQFCRLTSGTVNVTAVSSSHIAGDFSGTGTCTTAATGANTPFSVTNGAFSVGLAAQL